MPKTHLLIYFCYFNFIIFYGACPDRQKKAPDDRGFLSEETVQIEVKVLRFSGEREGLRLA